MTSKPKWAEYRGEPFLVQASDGFMESVADEDTPESIFERKEEALKGELGRVLSRLPDKEAQAISLWINGMTQQQIADAEGITQAAVSIRAKRGLERLFAMRDSGELGTLKAIWDGLDKVRKEMAAEVEIERATDSDAELPHVRAVELTDSEEKVLGIIESCPGGIHIERIAEKAWPGKKKANSWVRNGLRRLVKHGFVKQVGTGRYGPA